MVARSPCRLLAQARLLLQSTVSDDMAGPTFNHKQKTYEKLNTHTDAIRGRTTRFALRLVRVLMRLPTRLSTVASIECASASASRRLLLHAVATAAAAVTGTTLLSPMSAATAALPSISEYDAVQYKQRAVDVDAIATFRGRTYALGQNVKREDVEIEGITAAEGFDRLQQALGRTASLIDARAFEDARLALRSPLFSEFLGFNPGVRGFQANPKPSVALLKQLPATAAEPLEDALVSLKALDDFLLVNRVIFFNAEDKAQVEDLVAGGKASGTPGVPTKQVDLEEPKAMLADVVQALREARGA